MNLLPFSVFEQLGIGEIKPTRITLQLADRSLRGPKGIVEDVLVQVEQFVYPVDFIVLDTCPRVESPTQTPIIIKQPLSATSNAIIQCQSGLLNLTFGNMTTELNVFNISTQMGDDEEYHDVNLLDTLAQEYVDDVLLKDPLEVCLTVEEANFLDSPEVEYLYSLLG